MATAALVAETFGKVCSPPTWHNSSENSPLRKIIKMDLDEVNKFDPIVGVHYPGVVHNVSNMLETLGGIKQISSIYSEKNRRLELRFRPEDVFCKPAYASRRPVTGLLLKVKIKKKKKDFVSCQVIGCVTEEYKFLNLCDFQFLPTTKDECIYDKVVPQGLDCDWLNTKCPYFLPPSTFSRVDSVQNFNFNFNKLEMEENKPNVIGRQKRKRYGCTKFLTFDDPDVPTLPKTVPKGGLHTAKIITKETLERLQNLFQERPIYSRNAIKCVSKLPVLQLKCLLPCVAYYFTNGPWRSLWVRFGYDPRKDPSARIYQTLDYRVRSNLSKKEVKLKKTGGSLSYKFSNQGGKNLTVITRNPTDSSEKEEKSEPDDSYIFKPEMIPPSRQCFYQYCDIHIPEIKAMLDNLEPVDENAVCDEFDGWMPFSIADLCRDIMNKYVSEEVRRRNKLSSDHVNTVIVENQAPYYSGSESDLTDTEQTDPVE